MREKFFLFLSVLLLTHACAGFSSQTQVTAKFDKRTLRVNEELHLNIQILDAKGNIQAPKLPPFKGFDVFYTGRASKHSFVNGVSSSTVEFNYVLVPKTAGRYTLESIEVLVGSEKFHTEPVDIEVMAGSQPSGVTAPSQPAVPRSQAPVAAPPPTQQALPVAAPPVNYQPDDDNIFVQAWVDRPAVYPNQQVLLTYSLYTRYDTRYEGFEEEPQISGFWIEEFPMERDIARETVRWNGKRYIKADVRKLALFPTAAAEYTIQPGSLRASIRQEPQNTSVFDDFFNDSFFSGSGFFARRENRLLKPPPIRLLVKPFPETGKPASFKGAVGNFRVQANADKTTVKQNEPVTVRISVEGEGNIETLNKPEIGDVPGFKVYEADTSSKLFKTGNVIGGQKTFEIVFIPLSSGPMKIPSLEFSFFNPGAERYQTVRTPEFGLSVQPSDTPFQMPKNLAQQEMFKKDIKVEGRDIQYIWETLPSARADRIFRTAYYSFAAGDAILTLLIVIGLWRERREIIFSKDNALRRRKEARSQADARIRRLKSNKKANDVKDPGGYFEEIDKILTLYISDKFNLSAYGATREDLERELEQAMGAQDTLYQSILKLYRICDESRFGKGQVPNEVKHEALKILKETMNRVEKIRR